MYWKIQSDTTYIEQYDNKATFLGSAIPLCGPLLV
jgi:hypothetical protein